MGYAAMTNQKLTKRVKKCMTSIFMIIRMIALSVFFAHLVSGSVFKGHILKKQKIFFRHRTLGLQQHASDTVLNSAS